MRVRMAEKLSGQRLSRRLLSMIKFCLFCGGHEGFVDFELFVTFLLRSNSEIVLNDDLCRCDRLCLLTNRLFVPLKW